MLHTVKSEFFREDRTAGRSAKIPRTLRAFPIAGLDPAVPGSGFLLYFKWIGVRLKKSIGAECWNVLKSLWYCLRKWSVGGSRFPGYLCFGKSFPRSRLNPVSPRTLSANIPEFSPENRTWRLCNSVLCKGTWQRMPSSRIKSLFSSASYIMVCMILTASLPR